MRGENGEKALRLWEQTGKSSWLHESKDAFSAALELLSEEHSPNLWKEVNRGLVRVEKLLNDHENM